MIKSVNDITTDNFKELIKVVILGFITLDFFSPLTFKFIAMLFGEPEQMAITFKIFRTAYLLLPLGVMFLFLIWNRRFDTLRHLLSKISYGNLTGILLVIALCVITISTIACIFYFDSVLPFNAVKYLSIMSGVLIIATALSLILVHSKPKIIGGYQVAIVITLATLVGFYLLLNQYIVRSKHIGIKSSDTFVSQQYLSPFSEQAKLMSRDRIMDRLDSIRREISMKSSAAQIRLGFFKNPNQGYSGASTMVSFDSVTVAAEINKFLKRWSGNEGDTVKVFLQGINSKVDDINLALYSSADVGKISNQRLLLFAKELDVIASSLPYISLHLLSSASKQQNLAMKEAIDLLHYQQIIELIILLTIIPLLIFGWLLLSRIRVQKQFGNLLFLKCTICLYMLMAFQMMKPVNPNHINIQEFGWPFTYSNWYLPDYIQSIGTLNQDIDNSVVNFGDNIENEFDKQEIILLKNMISELQNAFNRIEPTVDSIKKDTDKIGK